MKKKLCLLMAAVLMLAGSSALGQEASRLMDVGSWVEAQYDFSLNGGDRGYLDTFLSSLHGGWEQDDVIMAQDSVEFPRAWPSQWLDGVIPEYTGTGWMYDLYVGHPEMSYAAKDIVHVAVTVIAYEPEEAEAYIAGLLENGFTEEENQRYIADWIESARRFEKDNYALTIVFGENSNILSQVDELAGREPETAPFVQFNVDFSLPPYELDTVPTQDTLLRNYAQSMEADEDAKKASAQMDQVLETYLDDYGRLNQVTQYPSAWPKEIFGEVIPEYLAPGTMYALLATIPPEYAAEIASAEGETQVVLGPLTETLIASLWVDGVNLEDVEAYAQALQAFGYHDVPEEDYSEWDIANAAEGEAYHRLTLPSVEVHLRALRLEGDELMMQLTLSFEGRSNNFFEE